MNQSIVFMFFFLIYTFLMLYSGRSGFYDTYDVRDFFVAGNSLGIFLSTATFVATWFSAASFLGLGSSLYIYGVSSIIYSILQWFIGAVFLFVLAYHIKDYDILTFSEFFYIRFNSRLLQFSVASLIIASYIFYITMQIKGFGLVMELLLNIPYNLAIFLVYLYILYTTFGGLYSVVKTDAINMFIIILASTFFGFYIIRANHGISNIISGAANINTPPVQGWDTPTPRGGLLDIFCMGLQPPVYLFTSLFGWGLGLAANPQYVIRMISAKDKSVARKMVLFSIALLSAIYAFIIIGSIGLRVLIPTAPKINNIDEIIPTLFSGIAPGYSVGIILIGIIAASVSTANSELLLIANSFTYDILKNLHHKNMDDEKMLSLNRMVIAIAGTLSLFLSFNPPIKVIEFGGNIWGGFASSTFIPLYAGVYMKKASRHSVEAAFFTGLISYLFFLTTIPYISNSAIHHIHPGVFAFAASFFAFIIVQRRSKNEKHRT
ncbi:MAG TPA: sodium:solute symporter family protein [Thermoanaerobacterales bacterium]|nr:sodium:solute symporter family protein [Thermoanaerobacterales bacterium]